MDSRPFGYISLQSIYLKSFSIPHESDIESLSYLRTTTTEKPPLRAAFLLVVRDRGIELLTSAWKADVIPFN
jgi:hypothetical protein